MPVTRLVAPLIPIVGDVKSVAAALEKELQASEWSPERSEPWLARIAERKADFPLHYEDPTDGTLAPQFVIQEIDRVTGHDAVVCTDVGQHQMWATQYYTYCLSLIHISEPTRRTPISYAVFCLKKKKLKR